jgi:hypothetical protein
MNVQRTVAVAAALCLGGGLSACSARIISPGAASSPGSAPSSPGGSASSPGSPAAHSSPLSIPTFSSGGGSTVVVNGRVKVGGPLGSFPVPPGAKVVENVTSGRTVDLVLDSVTPSRVSHFYGSALPHAGYTVSNNTSAAGSSFAGTSIKFTGHGYKGTIGAVAGLSGQSGITGNVVGVTLTPQ